jgi:hypothetical protein
MRALIGRDPCSATLVAKDDQLDPENARVDGRLEV